MNMYFNEDQLEANLAIVLSLEYLGVRFEETKEEKDSYGLFSKTSYYYSVPESSTIEVEDENLNEKIKTADSLKRLAKEMLIDMIIDCCQREFGEDSEFIDSVRNNISDYFKFYAKVRPGEVWNEELGNSRIKELTDEIKKASGYKEI